MMLSYITISIKHEEELSVFVENMERRWRLLYLAILSAPKIQMYTIDTLGIDALVTNNMVFFYCGVHNFFY